MTKLLSVIIPISGNLANLENLRETLKNGQEFEQEVEFILLFDEKQTPQSSKNWVELSSSSYENVKLHRQTFSSVGAARNFGIVQAASRWVTFTDADDVNRVDRFISMIRNAEIEQSDVAIGEFNSLSVESRKIIGLKKEKLVSKRFQITFGLKPGIWRCAFKSEGLNEAAFPNLSMAEDQVFIAKYFDVKRRIHFSSQVVYDYFVGDESSLTNRIEEIVKISQAIPLSTRIAIDTKGPYLQLLETLAISQLLSSIKYGGTWLRLSSTLKLFRFLFEGFSHRAWQRLFIVLQIVKR